MFNKRQEAELITSIQGRGEIPLKFAYLGDGYKNWEAISKKRSAGGINLSENNLIKKRVKDFLESFGESKKINVIDLGCGDGSPIFPILDELNRQKIEFRYIPLDISQSMLDLAEKKIKSKFHCEIKKVLFDFELGNFSDVTYDLKVNGYSNLMCFLGSTIGNFSDRNRVLTNMRDSMNSDDFLIIGVEMTNFSKINKIIPHYSGNLVENFLYYIPSKIGINKKNTNYEVNWNDKESQIEMWSLLKKDQIVKIGNEKILLESDEKVLLSRAVKFNEWTFTKLLSDVGFRTEILTTSKDRGYVISMVQPTRYSV